MPVPDAAFIRAGTAYPLSRGSKTDAMIITSPAAYSMRTFTGEKSRPFKLLISVKIQSKSAARHGSVRKSPMQVIPMRAACEMPCGASTTICSGRTSHPSPCGSPLSRMGSAPARSTDIRPASNIPVCISSRHAPARQASNSRAAMIFAARAVMSFIYCFPL